METEILSDDSYDDILPEARIFDNRVDDILNTKMEVLEEFYKKKEKDTLKTDEDCKIEDLKETVSEKKNCRKNNFKLNKKNKSKRNSIELDVNESITDDIEVIPQPEVKLSASAKKRLKKFEMEIERERKRIEFETREVLFSCDSVKTSKSKDVELLEDGLSEQDITLKIRYLSTISKITVGKAEAFNSIFNKIAAMNRLNPTEILLCLDDRNIQLTDTPMSLNLRIFDIIDCIPYKPNEDSKTDKLLLKIQSNDTRKKTEIFVHKLEKFEEIMKKYAELRKISLKNLVFEFDGEKIEGTDTPSELDMESGSCIDVRVTTFIEPKSKTWTRTGVIEQIPASEMLDICVLD